MTKRTYSPAMQAAIIRGLLRERTDLRASIAVDTRRLEQVEAEIAQARKGEF